MSTRSDTSNSAGMRCSKWIQLARLRAKYNDDKADNNRAPNRTQSFVVRVIATSHLPETAC